MSDEPRSRRPVLPSGRLRSRLALLRLMGPGLLLLGIAGMPAAQAGEEAPGKDAPSPLSVFRADARQLVAAWKDILSDTEIGRAEVEQVRSAARAAERRAETEKDEAAWQAAWLATDANRLKLHNRVFPHVLGWASPLITLFQAHESRSLTPQTLAQVSKVTADRVRAWVDVGEPSVLRGLLAAAPGGVPRALALPGRAHPRRALLSRVAARVAATPGTSDLDALLAVLSWEALFVAGRKPAAQLELVSADLVVLFSERSENGISKNDGRYYVGGRFRDRGFAKPLQDGSDQVRHFTWALRMFVLSQNAKATERLLDEKEQMDARTRKLPLNQADLALNRAAREVVAAIRGASPGAAGLEVAAWPALLERRLGIRGR